MRDERESPPISCVAMRHEIHGGWIVRGLKSTAIGPSSRCDGHAAYSLRCDGETPNLSWRIKATDYFPDFLFHESLRPTVRLKTGF